jgi:hypothetical protein
MDCFDLFLTFSETVFNNKNINKNIIYTQKIILNMSDNKFSNYSCTLNETKINDTNELSFFAIKKSLDDFNIKYKLDIIDDTKDIKIFKIIVNGSNLTNLKKN